MTAGIFIRSVCLGEEDADEKELFPVFPGVPVLRGSLAGCAAAEEEEPLSECRDAEEITELLYASNDRDRYFNYGFPVTEESVEDALKTGSRYGRVDSEEFQALSQIQEYFLEVYTEDYCEKLQLWTGEDPRWKEEDGILFQSLADGIYSPVTEENLEDSTILYQGDDKITARIYFDSQIDDTKYVMEYTLIRTKEGLRIEDRVVEVQD